jgi:hypothetical protein
MKKLLVIAFLFVLTTINAQGLFVRTYTKSVSVENNSKKPVKEVFLTVAFNKGANGILEFYFEDGTQLTFSKTSKITEDETYGGNKYQIFEAINHEFGEKVFIQVFEANVVRLIYSEGNYTEFYE